ncbi:ThiF family adenylyltransferase [Halococcus sp. PRR34]|uniref:HesA/MoeB/ThiF family protein n=1 Tax=Halococcus sp. PRR34 TaxID=3020830 RepID=UPI00235F30DF|nr:ThiF family adenylyltransferase [Halococcus sp. PRR34]
MNPQDERNAGISFDWEETTPEDIQPVADRLVLRISGADYDALRSHLIRRDGKEYAAYLLAGTHEYEQDGSTILEYLVRDVVCIPPFRYTAHSNGYVGIPGDVTREMIVDAETEDRFTDDLAVLMAHSHPWSESPKYSLVDDDAEPPQLASITGDREGPHGSLIVGEDHNSITGRVWPNDASAIEEHGPLAATPLDEVVVIDEHTEKRFIPTDSRLEKGSVRSDDGDSMRDRQALLHDEEGNDALADAEVTVIGAGGLGSAVAAQLAHIGVGRDGGSLTIVDPDVVEESNRSRILGAEPNDAGEASATPDDDTVVPAKWADEIEGIGTPKVDVVERYVKGIDTRISVETIREVGQSETGIEAIKTSDLVITAVDRQTPRRIISFACQQYHRPLVDAGVAIDTDGATSIVSRMTMSRPDQPCLDCAGVINEERLEREQHGDEDEAEYGIGHQPAVMTVNMDAAQRAAFAVHRYVTGLLAETGAPFDTGTFDMTSNRTQPDGTKSEEDCPYCHEESRFRALGDRAPDASKDLTRTAPAAVETSDRKEAEVESVNDPDSLWQRLRREIAGLVQ